MEKRVQNYLSQSYAVTKNGLKRSHLLKHGRPIIDDQQFGTALVESVGKAEGINPPFVRDNDPENPYVMQVGRKKAYGMVPLVYDHAVRTGDTRVFYAMDSIYSMRRIPRSNQGTVDRVVINKVRDVDKLLKFYKENEGSLLYSNTSIHFVRADMSANPIPIPMAIHIKARIGDWTGQVPNDFGLNLDYALGMSLEDAIKHGLVKPHNKIKIEMITFDYDPPLLMEKENRGKITVQKNYEIEIPFDNIQKHLQSISIGIMPLAILSKFGEPKRVQRLKNNINRKL